MPQARPGQQRLKHGLRLIDGAMQEIEDAGKPIRRVHRMISAADRSARSRVIIRRISRTNSAIGSHAPHLGGQEQVKLTLLIATIDVWHLIAIDLRAVDAA